MKKKKIVLVEEELDDIDRHEIVNLEYLLRLVLIIEQCVNHKVVVDGGQLTRNINQKKKPDVLQACRCPLCDKAICESIFSIRIWNIVNQLGKYDFSCGSVVSNLKEKQLFSDKMNRNRFDLILARHYWNFSTTENLRCLNSKKQCGAARKVLLNKM